MQQATVFLASRFEEFADLRQGVAAHLHRLRHTRVDVRNLNDGKPTHDGPLSESLRHVRESDIVVLLVGDTYGAPAKGHQESITHLEYRQALEAQKYLLVYALGDLYDPSPYVQGLRAGAAVPPPIRAWWEELQAHTVRVLDRGEGTAQLALEIGSAIQDALQNLKGIEREQVAAALPEAIQAAFDEESEEDLRSYGKRIADLFNIDVKESEAVLGEGTQAREAREKLEQMQEAMELGEYSIALKCLNDAQERVPLDPTVNLKLAKYHFMLGHRGEYDLAVDLAHRAFRTYERRNNTLKAASALVLLAQIHRQQGRLPEALGRIEEACRRLPGFAATELERARYLLLNGRRGEALDVIREHVFRRQPSAVAPVFTDQDFRELRREVQAFIERHNENVRQDALRVLRAGARIRDLLQGEAAPGADDQLPPGELRRRARSSVDLQRRLIGEGLRQLQEEDSSPEERLGQAQRRLAAAQQQEERALLELVSARALQRRAVRQAGAPQRAEPDRRALQREAAYQASQAQLGQAREALARVQTGRAIPPGHLQQAVALFYEHTLRRAPLLPYATIFSPHLLGKVIRGNARSIGDYQDQRQRLSQTSYRVTVDPAAPSWWPAPQGDGWELFTVTQVDGDGMTLSRTEAYTG